MKTEKGAQKKQTTTTKKGCELLKESHSHLFCTTVEFGKC